MKVFVEIGEGVEVAAKDVVKFFDSLAADAEALVSPQALLALAVLVTSLAPVVTDATLAAAQDGLNVPLDMETAALLIQTWPKFSAWVNTLKIRPAKPAPIAPPQGATP